MQIEIRGAERLSFRERQVVALKEMGMSNQEVARRLSVGVGTVATLFNRARRKGYQVVIVLTGDPLAIMAPDDDDEPLEESGDPEEPEDEPSA
ncbi:MAG TPA: sigma factor-like helix-turn-helix DNA-binding protein [Limnochordia bacterium]